MEEKKVKQSFTVSGKSGKAASPQVEIDLACRDLMLASLESMRKEAVKRPSSRRASGIAEFFPLEQDSGDIDDSESGQTEILEVPSVRSDRGSVASEADAADGVSGGSPDVKAVERTPLAGSDKQKIIDMIATEDIARAFSQPRPEDDLEL